MSVQWMPSEYNQRRPSRSEMMMQGLAPVGNAIGEYLHGKVQNYYDQQDKRRASEDERRQNIAIASLPQLKGVKGLESALMGLPPPQKIALVNSMLANPQQDASSSILNNLLSGGSFKAPEMQSPQEAPVATPTSVATQQAAAQRMGLAGNGIYAPGTPEYAQQVGQGQAQQQPPQGQAQQQQGPQEPMTPEGTIAPKPMKGEGLDLASFQGKKLGDLTDEQMEALKQGQPLKTQKALEAERKAQQNLTARQKTANVAESREERETEKDKREINKPVDTYIKDVVDKYRSQQQRDINLKTIESLSKKSSDSTKWKLGFGKMFGIDPELLQNRDENTIAKLSNDLLPARMREFQGQGARIFATEVDTMVNTIPSLMQIKEGRITISRFMQKMNELTKLEYNTVNELRKEYSKSGQLYPQIGDFEMQVYDKMENESSNILQEAKEIAEYGQVYKYKPGTNVDKLPDASSVPIGQKFMNRSGVVVESNGKKWINSKE